ncbi:alginate export family protein [uncultured Microbulbifer sp.]|uniref:alginate export family protein n=1 Tax=uncultured Microbulbifer sp. TaxID=348147 RepID=UPI0025FB3197|nr:alginate export family protein [uncultured Microbulbifer sp.]
MSPRKLPQLICATLIGAASASALQAQAADDSSSPTLIDALQNGKAGVTLRYRLENVDQANLADDANGSTLKSRLTWDSGSYRGFSAGLEMDDVSAIGNDAYNSTVNGNTRYPVVADPEGTEVNRAFLKYSAGDYTATAGRQRINLGDQRFVGGVGWRQNEQTYDGYRFQYGDSESLSVDYSYVYNVNRIFGEDSARGDLRGDIQLFNLRYPLARGHEVSLFLLDLDLANAVDASSRTLGLDYQGDFGPLQAHLRYAQQSDSGDSTLNYSAPYYQLEVAGALGPVNARLGHEVLGSDNGVGFATPLATLHKFQGFADQFLATPGAGVQDSYLGASAGLGGGQLGVTYHQFSAAEGSADWGSEWDLSYGRKLTDNLTGLLKFASYSADQHSVDTDKVWLQLTASF